MSELSEAIWDIRHELGRSMMDAMPEHAYITSTLRGIHWNTRSAVYWAVESNVYIAMRGDA